jgi:hydrogenase maturation protease
MSDPNPKILLLGLGNDILTDDAVGLNIAREIRRRLPDRAHVEVKDTCEMGLSLLDYIVGYRDLVLVDAVQTGQAPPGFLHEVGLDDLKVLPGMSPHFLGIGEILALGRVLSMDVPKRVKVFAVEVADPLTLGTQITPALRQAMPSIIERVMAAVQQWASATA